MKRARNDSESESIASNDEGTTPNTSARKRRRGIIEKRRRDRINNCMAELRRLVPQANEKQGATKLEKTELLQMTVEHLRALKQENGVLKDKGNASPVDYRAFGFRECVGEVSRYLSNTEGMDLQHPLRHRLITHLQRVCATRSITSPNIPIPESEAIASRLKSLPPASSHNTPPNSPENTPRVPASTPEPPRENPESPRAPVAPTMVTHGADSNHPLLPKSFPLQAIQFAPHLLSAGHLQSLMPVFGLNGQFAGLTPTAGIPPSQLTSTAHPQLGGLSSAQLAALSSAHFVSQLSANHLSGLTPDMSVFAPSSVAQAHQLNFLKGSPISLASWNNTALLNGNMTSVV